MFSNQKPMLQALNGVVQKSPPFWLMRQAGRYLPEYRKIRKSAKNFLEFCYTPDLAVEVALQPLRRFDMDAAILFSDILVIPDSLGQKVEFWEGQGPVLDPVRSVKEFEKLSKERSKDHLAPVFEAIGRLAKEIPDKTALIGFSGAPWTVAVYMVEGRGGTKCEHILALADQQPDDFQILIDLLVETTADYLTEQVKNGAEIIQIFDSWAGVLNKKQLQKWVIQPTRQIIEHLRKTCPGVPVIGFPRNMGELAEEYVVQTNVNGVSLDQETPLKWIIEALQPKCTVQGNLDNQILVTGGEALDQATMKILKALSPGPFIFNLGHGVLPETPPEHVAQMAALVRGWPGSAREIE